MYASEAVSLQSLTSPGGDPKAKHIYPSGVSSLSKLDWCEQSGHVDWCEKYEYADGLVRAI